MPIRVLVVEPQEIVLNGLEQSLLCPDIALVAASQLWAEAMRLLTYRRVDVILVDPQREPQTIFSDMEQLRWVNPKVKILIYTGLEHPAFSAKSFALGAKGYLPKTLPLEVLQNSIRAASRGESLWGSEDNKRCPASMLAKLEFSTGIPLSNREKELLLQIAQGATNKQAAINLKISYETVKENVQQLLKKLEVDDRTQAAIWGFQKGLV